MARRRKGELASEGAMYVIENLLITYLNGDEGSSQPLPLWTELGAPIWDQPPDGCQLGSWADWSARDRARWLVSVLEDCHDTIVPYNGVRRLTYAELARMLSDSLDGVAWPPAALLASDERVLPGYGPRWGIPRWRTPDDR